jgi:hypothetical protein
MSIDDEIRERMQAMAQSLLDATRAGKITWSLTDVEDKFVYAGTRSSVTIAFSSNNYDGDGTTLCLLNASGVIVDSLESGAEQTEEGWTPYPWNQLLDDLYHAARRVVHNVDEALESMMSDIARGTPSPPLPSPKKKRVEDPWASDNSGGYSDEPPF